jgi:hypothetical protein
MGTAAGLAVLVFGLLYIKLFDMYWGFENLDGGSNSSDVNVTSDGSNSSDVNVTSDATVKSDDELRESRSKNKKFKVGTYTFPIFLLSFFCGLIAVGELFEKIF